MVRLIRLRSYNHSVHPRIGYSPHPIVIHKTKEKAKKMVEEALDYSPWED